MLIMCISKVVPVASFELCGAFRGASGADKLSSLMTLVWKWFRLRRCHFGPRGALPVFHGHAVTVGLRHSCCRCGAEVDQTKKS